MGYYEKMDECGGYSKEKKEHKDYCCEVYVKVNCCEKHGWKNDGCDCEGYEDKRDFCHDDKKECRPKVFIDVNCPCDEKKGDKGHGKECCNFYVNVDFCKGFKKDC